MRTQAVARNAAVVTVLEPYVKGEVMQDRYAGDIGDYGKFALLRALASKGFTIGVNWYLFDTPPRELTANDGGKLVPGALSQYDPELAETLRAISQSPDRSVARLEEADLVPGAAYYAAMVSVEARREWHEQALVRLAEADLVFLDPDNGLLVRSVGKGSAKSPKYAFYEEVADYMGRGQSVVVYNHRGRQRPQDYFREICEGLMAVSPEAAGITAITFRKGSVRDYFVVGATSAHMGMVDDALKDLTGGVWGTSPGMCELASLPR